MIFYKSKMFGYNFFPFVEPSNVGTVELPDFDTIATREDIKLEETSVDEAVEEQDKKKVSIDDLAIDFEKVKISRGRQSKNTKGYKQDALKSLGKELKKRGFNVDFSSKDALIDSILLSE